MMVRDVNEDNGGMRGSEVRMRTRMEGEKESEREEGGKEVGWVGEGNDR